MPCFYISAGYSSARKVNLAKVNPRLYMQFPLSFASILEKNIFFKKSYLNEQVSQNK